MSRTSDHQSPIEAQVEVETRGTEKNWQHDQEDLSLDSDGVLHERAVRMKRSRSGFASHVSRKYREFIEMTDSQDPGLSTKYEELCTAFEKFEATHQECVKLMRLIDPSCVSDMEEQFLDLQAVVKSAHSQVGIVPEDSASHMGSSLSSRGSRSGSTVSAHAKASARKAALMQKMLYAERHKGIELEKLQAEVKLREADMRLKHLQLESELKAAEAEEQVLSQLLSHSIGQTSINVPTQREQNEPAVARKLDFKIEAGDIISSVGPAKIAALDRQLGPDNPVGSTSFEGRLSQGGIYSERGYQEPLINGQVHTVAKSNFKEHAFQATHPAERRHHDPIMQPSVDTTRYQENISQKPVLVASDQQSHVMDMKHLIEIMSLPKVSIKKFDGDPLCFWEFFTSFQNAVGRTSVDDATKLNRLFEYCCGTAARVIKPCAIMEPTHGYQRALDLLKVRFGNEYLVSEAWVRKVTCGKALKPNSSEQLQEFADEMRGCIETLRAMKHLDEIDTRSRMIQILDRLPLYIQTRWRKQAISYLDFSGRYPNIEMFADFIDKIAREANDPVFGNLEKVVKEKKASNFAVQRQSENTTVQRQSENTTVQRRPENTTTVLSQPRCYMCKGQHILRVCSLFAGMSAADRLAKIKSLRLCYNCLESRHHQSHRCYKPSQCGLQGCTEKHSRLLHQSLLKAGTASGNKSADRSVPSQASLAVEPEVVIEDGMTAESRSQQIALPVVAVTIRAGEKQVKTHALLDNGSTRSFCDRELVKQLGLETVIEHMKLKTLHGSKDMTVWKVTFEVLGNRKSPVVMTGVGAIQEFPKFESNTKADLSKWEHLQGLNLRCTGDVRLLIGQDHPHLLQPFEVRVGDEGEPYAVRTRLGWTVNGPVRNAGVVSLMNFSAFINSNSDARLEHQLKRFWEIEGTTAADEISMSKEDKKVKQLWDETTELQDGHYSVRIPFKKQPADLPNNRPMAEQRLASLGKRLKRNPALHEEYKAGIAELIKQGFAEDAPEKCEDTVWYLPHHSVVNPQKKFRIVFDCAAKYGDASLNQEVSQGPNLVNKLLGVLIRFREKPIAVQGDIKSMFHQVKVPAEQRDVLRFLWWKDGEIGSSLVTYRMTVHLFGGVWSPSCAAYALARTAQDNSEDFEPEVTAAIVESFYVDDCLVSCQDEATAIALVKGLCQMTAAGGFHLTKWISNSWRVLSQVKESDRSKAMVGLEPGDELPINRVLGVYWDTEKDHFGFKIDPKDTVYTRRGVLSTMSSIYDPLGMLAPVVIVAKMILQSETRLHKGWDEALEESNQRRWMKWLQDLVVLEAFRISRCIVPKEFRGCGSMQLHHFCDASENAYGTATYMRVEFEGEIWTSFVIGKSRLSPLKQLTIPRLELCAAVLAVEVELMLRSELRLQLMPSVFWTDSTIVISYIRNTETRFKTFVANRVAKIQSFSEVDQWRHVPSELNPADDCSRGLSTSKLLADQRWSLGPVFLRRDVSEWPIGPGIQRDLGDDVEMKNIAEVMVVEEVSRLDELLTRYSSWFRLIKAVAWLLRFKLWLKDHTRDFSKYLSAGELKEAKLVLVRYVQRKVFREEIAALKCSRTLAKTSRVYRLDPYVADDGVMRVMGRLESAALENTAKHPAIMPRDHHVCELIVRDYHQMYGHVGKEHVLSLIREQFWIPRPRPLVNRMLQGCVTCKRRRGLPMDQRMASLPPDRVESNKPPFTNVGVDVFGPFLVKRGRSREKRYGCLFTCLGIRAVHIEMLHSLEADSFINALVRFSARRGFPELMRSDNGTNFKGAQTELDKEFQKMRAMAKVQKYLLKNQMTWEYNPPGASHMGGCWERMIRTVRNVLTAVVGSQVLDDERLETFFCEAESIVNGRPITTVTDDPSDMEPLTPAHLLLLRKGPDVLPGKFVKDDMYSKRWRHVQFLADRFWSRWRREYLQLINLRQKWIKERTNLEVGDIVLVVDEATPRKDWLLGRIIETTKGSDGLVRSATVKTQNGNYVRPITKLCLLESVAL